MSPVLITFSVKPAVSREKIFKWAVDYLELKKAADKGLEIRIVGTKSIERLNARYLNKREATDVLSFPLEAIPGEKKRFVGTVVICDNIIVKQARKKKTPVDIEYREVVCHGINHLLGIHHE